MSTRPPTRSSKSPRATSRPSRRSSYTCTWRPGRSGTPGLPPAATGPAPMMLNLPSPPAGPPPKSFDAWGPLCRPTTPSSSTASLGSSPPVAWRAPMRCFHASTMNTRCPKHTRRCSWGRSCPPGPGLLRTSSISSPQGARSPLAAPCTSSPEPSWRPGSPGA